MTVEMSDTYNDDDVGMDDDDVDIDDDDVGIDDDDLVMSVTGDPSSYPMENKLMAPAPGQQLLSR